MWSKIYSTFSILANSQRNKSYIICGDLNAKHIHRFWNCLKATQSGKILFNEMWQMDILVHFPPTPIFFNKKKRNMPVQYPVMKTELYPLHILVPHADSLFFAVACTFFLFSGGSCNISILRRGL